MSAETIGDHLNCPFEVRADLIHLVDEAEARHVKAIGLAPNRFRLWLYAGDRGKYRNCAIKHAERTFDFDLEVDVAGVSMIVIDASRHSHDVAAAEIVIPCFFSSAWESVLVLPV